MDKKIFRILLCGMLCLCCLLTTGCGDSDIKVNVSCELYDYDSPTNTASDEALNPRSIECGRRYKLLFKYSFENDTLPSKAITATLSVTLGKYDTSENKLLQANWKTSDGGDKGSLTMSETKENSGTWEGSIRLDKDSSNDEFSTYFIIGIDSLGDVDNASGSDVEEQPITLSFKDSAPKDPHTFYIYGFSETFSCGVQPIKGDLDFTYEDNISKNIGESAQINSIVIAKPDVCGEVSVKFYKDETKYEKYGELTIDETEFDNESITVSISDNMLSYLGQTRYDNLLSSEGGGTVYLYIVAAGGTNYNDGVIEFTFNFS